MNKCHACEINIKGGTVCEFCAGWQLKVGFACFICNKEIINSEERYLEKGNVCDECTDKVDKWYWWVRSNRYRKKVDN